MRLHNTFTFFSIWLLFACTSPAQKNVKQVQETIQTMVESNDWPLDTNYCREQKHDIIPYQHLANIGDCFVFTTDGKKYHGVLLYEISKTVEDTSYGFLIQPYNYSTLPNIDSFKKHPFAGHAIPNGIVKRREVGFLQYGFLQQDFIKVYPKLKLIGHVDLSSNEARIGGESVPRSLSELVEQINEFKQSLEKNDDDLLSEPKDTIFNYTVLKMALGEDDKKQPYSNWVLSKKLANAIALKMMPEDYWWNPADDFAPFGNDDGSDALYGFRDWRLKHPLNEPSDYFGDLEASWETSFKQKDWTEYEKIKKEKEKNILYTGIDYAIVGTAFAQLVLEGKISPTLKIYAFKAIGRQKLLTEKGDYKYTPSLKKERLLTWAKQMSILEKAP